MCFKRVSMLSLVWPLRSKLYSSLCLAYCHRYTQVLLRAKSNSLSWFGLSLISCLRLAQHVNVMSVCVCMFGIEAEHSVVRASSHSYALDCDQLKFNQDAPRLHMVYTQTKTQTSIHIYIHIFIRKSWWTHVVSTHQAREWLVTLTVRGTHGRR